MTKNIQLYVGCALTDAPEEFKQGVENFKHALRAEGYEVFDFVGLVNGTAVDVYNWDIKHCVKNCQALIAICDFPSIGLGYEMNEAVNLKKPVLAVAHNDSRVTRLVHGAAEVEPNLRFETYQKLSDIVVLVNEWLVENNLAPVKTASTK
jgi:hypothetical protein